MFVKLAPMIESSKVKKKKCRNKWGNGNVSK